jgi:hypothetical protein
MHVPEQPGEPTAQESTTPIIDRVRQEADNLVRQQVEPDRNSQAYLNALRTAYKSLGSYDMNQIKQEADNLVRQQLVRQQVDPDRNSQAYLNALKDAYQSLSPRDKEQYTQELQRLAGPRLEQQAQLPKYTRPILRIKAQERQIKEQYNQYTQRRPPMNRGNLLQGLPASSSLPETATSADRSAGSLQQDSPQERFPPPTERSQPASPSQIRESYDASHVFSDQAPTPETPSTRNKDKARATTPDEQRQTEEDIHQQGNPHSEIDYHNLSDGSDPSSAEGIKQVTDHIIGNLNQIPPESTIISTGIEQTQKHNESSKDFVVPGSLLIPLIDTIIESKQSNNRFNKHAFLQKYCADPTKITIAIPDEDLRFCFNYARTITQDTRVTDAIDDMKVSRRNKSRVKAKGAQEQNTLQEIPPSPTKISHFPPQEPTAIQPNASSLPVAGPSQPHDSHQGPLSDTQETIQWELIKNPSKPNETWTIRTSPIKLLSEAEMNEPGIHFTHYNKYAVFIPKSVYIALKNKAIEVRPYSQIAKIMNKKVPESIDTYYIPIVIDRLKKGIHQTRMKQWNIRVIDMKEEFPKT